MVTKKMIGELVPYVVLVSVFISSPAMAENSKKPRRDWSALLKNHKIYRNIPYVENPVSKSQQLDLYLPKRAKKPIPLVVWIHGGGWRAGDKRFGPFKPLLNKKYAVASINYRLSQEAKFPAQIQDCKSAVVWLKKNAVKFNIDPDRVGAWGASAGGHLSALLGVTSGTDKLESVQENGDFNSDVEAVCDWFGPVDLLKLVKYKEDNKEYTVHPMIEQLLGEKGVKMVDAAYRASPVSYATKDTPPTLIMHGNKDKLVRLNQSEILFKKLKDLGVDVTLKVVSGGHGFPGFGLRTKKVVVRFFDQHLRR